MELLNSLPKLPPDALVVEIDGTKALSLRSFYPRVAKALLFPDYFGKNLDALFDCLCSLEALGQKRVVLVVKNAKQFLSKEKKEKKQAALEVLREAEKAENRSDGVIFKVIGLA